jgi:predicted DNA-binding WGR domain protein
MYNLITRWGRFGDSGQYQNTPFSDLREAIKEYNKIFSTKTKNNWEEIKSDFDKFEKKEKKEKNMKC